MFFRKKIGFSLIEVVVVTVFMFAICMIFYKLLTVSTKTSNSSLSAGTTLKTALVFSDIVSKPLKCTQASLITVYPMRDSQHQSKAFAFPYPGDYASSKLSCEFTDFGWQKLDLNTTSPFTGKLNVWETVVVYYYDKDGSVFGKDKKDKKDSSKYEDCIYEIVGKFPKDPATEAFFLQKTALPTSFSTLLDDNLQAFVENARKAGSFRRVAEHVVFFKVSLESYPMVRIDTSVAYGRGGSSVSAGAEDVNIGNTTEVFDLSFDILPGI